MSNIGCPHCEKLFNFIDMPWTCPKCDHLDEHWNPVLICRNCGFKPDDSTVMHCPLCGNAINIMSFMFGRSRAKDGVSESVPGRRYFKDLLFSNNVLISPEIQNARQYPFTLERARTFFDAFVNESFDLDRQISSIVIISGKENLPQHSFASGHLFAETLDELEHLSALPNPVGNIHMEYGGNTTEPLIRVTGM